MEVVDVNKIEKEHLTDDPTEMDLPLVLPIEILSKIIGHLTSDSKSILNWREVSPDIRDEVDKHTIFLKPTELNPLTVDAIPVENLWRTKLEDLATLAKFQAEMENIETNPFPTRNLCLNSFNPQICDCTRLCNCRRLVDNEFVLFSQFCKRFGKEVKRLTFIMDFHNSMTHLKKSLFHNFPNLCHLEIKLMSNALPLIEESFLWLEHFNFPPLPHLTNLKVHLCGVKGGPLVTKIVRVYGSQIKSLTVSIYTVAHVTPPTTETFRELHSEDVPNLTNLRIQFEPERGESHVLNFLKNGNWSLKQITLHGLKSHFLANYKLADVINVISKYASTLEILHLYFWGYSRIMFRLHCLSNPEKRTPEEVANDLQLSVTLPLVRECILSYGGVNDVFAATAKLSERFENLKTLHLYDERLDEPIYIKPNYEEELKAKWWPVVSPESKLERVIIFNGNEFNDNVVVHHISNKPDI